MFHLKCPPFENTGAGQTAIIPRLPLGEVYHGIMLELGGTSFSKAQIERILIRLGGKVIWDVTGAQLDTMNQYMGMTANAAYLLIPFSEFNARTILGEEIGAIDTVNFDYSGFSIEVDIAAAATAPTLTAHRLVTNSKSVEKPEYLPLFKAMIPATHTIGAAGTYNLPIPLGSQSGALIKRIHHFHTNITELSVRLNGQDIFDQIKNALAQFWQNNLTRVTQAGHLCFDPMVLDNQSSAIPTINKRRKMNNIEWRETLSAADTIDTVSELYATIGSI